MSTLLIALGCLVAPPTGPSRIVAWEVQSKRVEPWVLERGAPLEMRSPKDSLSITVEADKQAIVRTVWEFPGRDLRSLGLTPMARNTFADPKLAAAIDEIADHTGKPLVPGGRFTFTATLGDRPPGSYAIDLITDRTVYKGTAIVLMPDGTSHKVPAVYCPARESDRPYWKLIRATDRSKKPGNRNIIG